MGKAIALPANIFQRQMRETGGIPAPAGLAVPQAIRAIGKGNRPPAAGHAHQLSNSIIRPCFLPVNDQLFMEVLKMQRGFPLHGTLILL